MIQTPFRISAYTPLDFGATVGADYVLITHRDFLTAAQRLADNRASQGYTTMVVDVDVLYDAFNYGIYQDDYNCVTSSSSECLAGYWIYPRSYLTSLAVELLTLENAGAVATFSPTGLGVAQGHDVLNNGFYDIVFKDGVQTLGWAAVAAKLDLFQSGGHFDLIHTYTVFGDPALKIPATYFVFLPSIYR